MITGDEPINFQLDWGNQGEKMTGLTIRQYYAGLAVQGICSQSSGDALNNQYTVNGGWLHPETVAKASVEIADALIKELNKPLT